MKSILMAPATLGLAAAASLAMAAAAPAVAHADDDWTGWYLGVNAGGATGSSSQTSNVNATNNTYFAGTSIAPVNAAGAQKIKPSGFSGGAQVGFNQQSGGWMWGVEADIQALSLKKDATVTGVYPCCGPATYSQTAGAKTSWLFTARPRVGWVSNDWLVYGTAGVAVTDVKYTHRFTDTFTASPGAMADSSISKTKAGWTAGVGVEHAMAGGWSVKGEYLYADFGKEGSSGHITNPAASSATTFDSNADLKVNLFRVGLNKKF